MVAATAPILVAAPPEAVDGLSGGFFRKPRPLLRSWRYGKETPVAVAVESHYKDDEQQQQPQYPVATFVTAFAVNLRSSLDQIIADAQTRFPLVEHSDHKEDARQFPERLTGPSARPTEPFQSCTTLSDAFHEKDRDGPPPLYLADEEWVVDAFDESEFYVLNGQLVEVSVPLPTTDIDDEYQREIQQLVNVESGCPGNLNRAQRNFSRVHKWMRRRHAKVAAKREARRMAGGNHCYDREEPNDKICDPHQLPHQHLPPAMALNRLCVKKKRLRKRSNVHKTIQSDSAAGNRNRYLHAECVSNRAIRAPVSQCIFRPTETSMSATWTENDTANKTILYPSPNKPKSVTSSADSLERFIVNKTAAHDIAASSKHFKARAELLDNTADHNFSNLLHVKSDSSIVSWKPDSHIFPSLLPCSRPQSFDGLDIETNEVSIDDQPGDVPAIHIEETKDDEVFCDDNVTRALEIFTSDTDEKYAKNMLSRVTSVAAASCVIHRFEAVLKYPLVSLSPLGPSFQSMFTGMLHRRSHALNNKLLPMVSTVTPQCEETHAVFACNDETGTAVYNNTLKVVFTGSPKVGKTSLIRELTKTSCFPTNASDGCPSKQTFSKGKSFGVDVLSWMPSGDTVTTIDGTSHGGEICSNRPFFKSDSLKSCDKYSIWDFSGGVSNGGVHHAVQSLFFSPNSLYVVVWDMAVKNPLVRRQTFDNNDFTQHSIDYDDDDDFSREVANRNADRALERDILDNVIFWIDCIQKRAPHGSAIIPVGSFDDAIDSLGGSVEACRRCNVLKQQLLQHYGRSSSSFPNLVFGSQDDVLRVSSIQAGGSDQLKKAIMNISTKAQLFDNHIHLSTPCFTDKVRKALLILKKEHKVIHISQLFNSLMRDTFIMVTPIRVQLVLRFLSSVGEVVYFDNGQSNGGDLLNQFVVLNPMWLVAAVSCIIRQDLRAELIETRSFMDTQAILNADQLYERRKRSTYSNCPVISASEAFMLWQSMEFMRDASDKIKASGTTISLFSFLESVFVQYGIFVPCSAPSLRTHLDGNMTEYLLPSLMPDRIPSAVWSFKSKESWKTTLCQSWLFNDCSFPGLMDRITASVMKAFLCPTLCGDSLLPVCWKGQTPPSSSGARVRVKDVICWKNAFMIKVAEEVSDLAIFGGFRTINLVEIFAHFVRNDSPHCVSSRFMSSRASKLVVSAKGKAGLGGEKIWNLGYSLVLNSIQASIDNELGTNAERQVVCPECLSTGSPDEAISWNIDDCLKQGHSFMTCEHGHRTQTTLLCGVNPLTELSLVTESFESHTSVSIKRVSSLLASVVLVGLWDDQGKRITNVGSGFVADRKNGLIITASHVLFDMTNGKGFGKYHCGLKHCKVVIGVIPQSEESTHLRGRFWSTAYFQYFADVLAKDIRNVDACVLRIRTKFEHPVGGEGEGCAHQVEHLLFNNVEALKNENLQHLKITNRCQMEENVRVIGYNQGGEGILQPGMHINRSPCFANGYVCKRFKPTEDLRRVVSESWAGLVATVKKKKQTAAGNEFTPLEEIVVICPTIQGHSGGPFVNQHGAVIGILSRADTVDPQRCYVVPSSELKRLLKMAKAKIALNPMELYRLT